jgi:hypothetical protein
MPISFAATDAAWNTADAVGAAAVFDPAVGTTQFLAAVGGTMYAWIGGTVAPTGTQAAGVYQATITLDVVYTGN